MGSSRGMERCVKSQQRLETRYVFEIDENAGSPQLLSNARHASISRAGAGDYTLTLTVGASRNLVALASGLAPAPKLALEIALNFDFFSVSLLLQTLLLLLNNLFSNLPLNLISNILLPSTPFQTYF